MKALWKYESAMKIHKCPAIIAGANFHLETVKLCILNNNYVLCILLKKNPFFRWFCKHTWITVHILKHITETTTILESWVLLLFSLQVFTTVCSSSDLVGVFFSMCLKVWSLGYNDFNNLVMQTLWWLHNKILRYIHKKKIFRFFELFPSHMQSKFEKSTNMTNKKNLWKNQKRCQKTQNFTLISNPLKKFEKNAQKKSY